jgi:membrane protease YdiL (CAAX protease family)
MNLVADLAVWLGAIIAAMIAENIAITRIFGISAYVASFEGQPQIWLCRFLEPIVAISILTLWLRRHGESWHQLGLHRPKNWNRFAMQVAITAAGLVGLVLFWIFGVLRPFNFYFMPPPDIHDGSTLAAALSFSLLGTGLNQELLFRGFLLNRLAKTLGGAWRAANAITAVIFGLFHIALGTAAAIDAAVAGLILGGVYLRSGRNLWVVVAAHSVANAILILFSYFTS